MRVFTRNGPPVAAKTRQIGRISAIFASMAVTMTLDLPAALGAGQAVSGQSISMAQGKLNIQLAGRPDWASGGKIVAAAAVTPEATSSTVSGADLSGGLRTTLGGMGVDTTLFLRGADLAADDYRMLGGARVKASRTLGEGTDLSLALGGHYESFRPRLAGNGAVTDDRDGMRWRLSAGLGREIMPGVRLSGEMYWRRQLARSDRESQSLSGISVLNEWRLGDGRQIRARLGISQLVYDDTGAGDCDAMGGAERNSTARIAYSTPLRALARDLGVPATMPDLLGQIRLSVAADYRYRTSSLADEDAGAFGLEAMLRKTFVF